MTEPRRSTFRLTYQARKIAVTATRSPDHWLPEYTTELLNVLHVLARLVDLEPRQTELLDRICAGPTIGLPS